MLFEDQLNRHVNLDKKPIRIISTVPSQSELLAYLELDNEVIGITKFCVHPQKWYNNKMRVGGTKTLDIEKIKSLQPDLIICNKEENEQVQIKALERYFPVWISDVTDLVSAKAMISKIGTLCDREEKAANLLLQIDRGFTTLYKYSDQKKALYLIWNDPFMAAGKDTFINSMIETCGWINSIKANRYPELSIPEIQILNPDFVLLSSEPYPFKGNHLMEMKKILPKAEVFLIDGTYFSWYGSRLTDAAEYFNNFNSILHAE